MLMTSAGSQCLFPENDMMGLLKCVSKNANLYSLNKHCVIHIFKYTSDYFNHGN